MTHVAPKCWDAAGPARPCRGTLADGHTYWVTKEYMRTRIEVAQLIYVPRVELRCTAGLLGSFH
jgi:hypothetical protein